MVFNPNSRESCEYYGVDFDTKQPLSKEEKEYRDYVSSQEHRRSLMPRSRGGSEDYFPQQSRDYALSHTIPCNCILCPANKNSYCEVPSLIKINTKSQCETGLKFTEAPIVREAGTEFEKKNEYTPDWFFNRWEVNCPPLTKQEQLAILTKVDPTKWDYDVLRVSQEKGIESL